MPATFLRSRISLLAHIPPAVLCISSLYKLSSICVEPVIVVVEAASAARGYEHLMMTRLGQSGKTLRQKREAWHLVFLGFYVFGQR